MQKLFFFDCETTGLDPLRHDILTLSYIIEINGEFTTAGTLKIRPSNPSTIDPGALLINGLTLDEISSFDPPERAYTWLVAVLSRYVDRYDPADKFWPVAYRADFDYSFLAEFFKRNSDQYFNSYIRTAMLDPLPIIRMLDYLGVISPLPNHKLKTVADALGIPIQAHNSSSDVAALREIFHRIRQYFQIIERHSND
jgi:DNA polymerase III epsilon subunit-like protein